MFKKFRCEWLAHDFVGAGRKADTMVRQAMFVPEERIMPMSYTATGARNLVGFSPPANDSQRYYFTTDKTWSISLLLHLIRIERVLFPKMTDSLDKLLTDFLSLTTEKRERTFTGDVFLITRSGKAPDDVVHAINFAAVATFHVTQKFPDVAEHFRSALAKSRDLDDLHPLRDLQLRDWEA